MQSVWKLYMQITRVFLSTKRNGSRKHTYNVWAVYAHHYVGKCVPPREVMVIWCSSACRKLSNPTGVVHIWVFAEISQNQPHGMHIPSCLYRNYSYTVPLACLDLFRSASHTYDEDLFMFTQHMQGENSMRASLMYPWSRTRRVFTKLFISSCWSTQC